jgi:hypothetical protein
MKHLKIFVISGICLLALSMPALAREEFVTVTFRPGIDKPFVQMLAETFKSPAPRQTGPQTWVFKVPTLRTRNQYAELFASLVSVSATDPAPIYQVADHINPTAVNIQPYQPGTPVKSTDYVPRELLVKFKPEASAADIRFINSHHGAAVLSVVSGIKVHRLRLPAGLSVEEAVARYGKSPLVEYAEPNYRMKVPSPVPSGSGVPVTASSTPGSQIPNGTALVTQIPLDGGNQIIVDFRPGTPLDKIAQFHLIYGTREVEKRSHYSYRLQLPQGLNPGLAVRIFMLHPAVVHVQRLYA